MKNEKLLDLREIGKLDDLADGVFVVPSGPKRDEEDQLMKRFIEQRKLARNKGNV